MKQYHDCHNLGHTEATIMMIGPLSNLFRGIQTIFFQHTAINFVKFVCHKENFCNFVGGEHAIISCILLVIQHYKDTKIITNHQIIRRLYFRRTHVKIGDEFNNHSQAYKNVMNDKTFYPKTTPMYKAFIKKAYNMYKSKEK